ncbi:MAG TPA: hypothetical protein VF681_15255 [Abditibacteriaceae bacterium]|jgi:hypothetical protein
MSRLRSASPLFRLAILVLAALQFVAPTLHVCAQGGFGAEPAQCHPRIVCHTEADVAADATRIWRMAIGGTQAADEHQSPHCLAALLQTLPAQAASVFSFSTSFAPRVVRFVAPVLRASQFVLASPPARGPPLS